LNSPNLLLAERLAQLFAGLSQVEAVALGGSSSGGASDHLSDIDLYVYTHADIPLAIRQEIVQRAGGASQSNMGLNYWGAGDEWFDAQSGIEADVVFFDAEWMEERVKTVMVEHQASMGYTTCFCHTVKHSIVLLDPKGWLGNLQAISRKEYPEPLRRNIISWNHPVLRSIIPAYAHQIQKAVQRKDLVSINHRLAAFFASYFDVVFALNRVLHPGDKRQLAFAAQYCSILPLQMVEDVELVLRSAASTETQLMVHLDRLMDRLDACLREQGFAIQEPTPQTTLPGADGT